MIESASAFVLADASALVALIDRGDRHHDACVSAIGEIRTAVATVWPALTEAMHLLGTTPRGQRALLDMIDEDLLGLAELGPDDVPRMAELMEKDADLPMDFADAALVRAAERYGVSTIITLDRHFTIYRLTRRQRFTVVPHLPRRR